MSLLLYAVTDAERLPAETPPGVGGATVGHIARGGLVAVVSEHDRPPELDEESLWMFERVIEIHMTAGAVLPVRYGTLLADASAAELMLGRRGPELAQKLGRIRGAVELSVRGIWPQDSEPPSSGVTGTDYMRARLEPQRRAGELAARLHAGLDGHARESRQHLLRRASIPVTAAFLVDREREQDFLDGVRALDAQLEDVDLVCTGPWPAYSFVGDAVDE